MHHYDLIVMLAAGFAAALVFGYITQRLGLSPIVGYLLAGIAIGPYTPGFVADMNLAAQLAEIGVILLMFGVGLHFRVSELLAVKSIAIPGAVAQIAASTVVGLVIGMSFGWELSSSLILGVAASVASTVVLVRVLTDNNQLETPQGHIAVGWLIVEDIFTVFVLVILPPIAATFSGGELSLGVLLKALGIAVVKLAILGFIILSIGAKAVSWIMTKVAATRSRELFTLTVLALALAIAAGSALIFDASFALGAFLAGMVVGQSRSGHQAFADALPMRDAFAVLFFISAGMLFDPAFVIANPGLILLMLGVVLVVKPLVALVLVLSLGYSLQAALTIAVALAQIGEFTFILSSSALQLNLFTTAGQSTLIAVALISISLNPLLFRWAMRYESGLKGNSKLAKFYNRRTHSKARALNQATSNKLARNDDPIRAIVVGYGPVGKTLTRILTDFNIRPLIIELNMDTVDSLAGDDIPVIFGDAANAEILSTAGIADARFLILTIPDLASRIPVIETARQLNSSISIIARARYIAELEELRQRGVNSVCYEEVEAAVGLSEYVLTKAGVETERIREEVERIRADFAV